MEDLITYFPRDYEDRSKPRNIEDLVDDEYGLIKAVCVTRVNSMRIHGGRTMQKLMVRDETSSCQITWFNQPYLKDKFRVRRYILFLWKSSGKAWKNRYDKSSL